MAVGVDYYLPGESHLMDGDLSIRTAAHPGLSIIRGLKPGQYQIRPPSAKDQGLTLRGGRWLGNKDCGRVDCHPDEHQGWLTTNHATVFTRGISGELPLTFGRYQEHCLPCHTLGNQPGAYNDGFDELQQSNAWRFPERLTPSAWRRLPAALKERANVQCESCHGPAWFYVGYGIDICAQCHDAPPRYRTVQQLKGNRMSQAERSLAELTDKESEQQNCKQCHLASGYLHSLRGHRSTSRPDLDLDTTRGGVTCATCHDPHDRGCFRQLRLCGTVEVPGLTFDAGQGALCISCHNNESDAVQGQLVRPFIPGKPRPRDMAGHAQTGHGRARNESARSPLAAPHAPQFQLVTSRGGKFLELPKQLKPSKPNPHMFVVDSCVGCHYDRASTAAQSGGHTFRLAPGIKRNNEPPCSSRLLKLSRIRESRHTRPCQDCHGSQKTLNVSAKGDYDGDGKIEGIVDEIQGLLRILAGHIAAQAEHKNGTVVIVDEKVALADESCRPLKISLETRPQLYKAAFNLMLVLRDGSGGIHNPWYTVRLLQQTIESLDRTRASDSASTKPRTRTWMRR
jgi:hypothetical protein